MCNVDNVADVTRILLHKKHLPDEAFARVRDSRDRKAAQLLLNYCTERSLFKVLHRHIHGLVDVDLFRW